jgi:hypothetical protein
VRRRVELRAVRVRRRRAVTVAAAVPAGAQQPGLASTGRFMSFVERRERFSVEGRIKGSSNLFLEFVPHKPCTFFLLSLSTKLTIEVSSFFFFFNQCNQWTVIQLERFFLQFLLTFVLQMLHCFLFFPFTVRFKDYSPLNALYIQYQWTKSLS